MNVRPLLFGASFVSFVIAGVLFYLADSAPASKSEQPVVYVSTFSLYEAARNVGGKSLKIQSIVPPGSDPHLFTPDPGQMAKLSSASLLIYNGAGFERWIENLKGALPSSLATLDMSKGVTLIHSAHEEHDEHDEHSHGGQDPHYWLDLDNMIAVTQTMDKHFSKMWPEQASVYHANAAGYITELKTLKNQYSQSLKNCDKRILVSNHDAFGYLAHANDLKNVSVIGLSSDEQPNPSTLSNVIDVVKANKVKSIFFESLVNDNVSQTIARETGAKALSLHPLENITVEEAASGATYISLMRDNLLKLHNAMECR